MSKTTLLLFPFSLGRYTWMRDYLHSLEMKMFWFHASCSPYLLQLPKSVEDIYLRYIIYWNICREDQKSLMASHSSPRHLFWCLIFPCIKEYIKQFSHSTNSCSFCAWGMENKNHYCWAKNSRINSNSDKWYFLLLLSYQRKLNCICISTVFAVLNNNRLFYFASYVPFY